MKLEREISVYVGNIYQQVSYIYIYIIKNSILHYIELTNQLI